MPSDSEVIGIHSELTVGGFGQCSRLRLIREASELVLLCRIEATFVLLRTRLQVRELGQEVLCVVSLVELGQVRWRHGFGADGVPVDGREPGMTLNFLCVGGSTTQTLVRVLVEQLHAQVARIVRQEVVVQAWLCILDVLIELFTVFAVEGWQSN